MVLVRQFIRAMSSSSSARSSALRHVGGWPTHKLTLEHKEHNTTNNNNNPVVLVSCGSFSPITNMHLQILEAARDHCQLELGMHVVGGFVSPVHDGYGKHSLVDAKHRLAMCEAAVLDSSWITVGQYELNQSQWTPTHKVLQHLHAALTSHFNTKELRVFMVCGADLIQSFTDKEIWSDEETAAMLGDEKLGLLALERGDTSVQDIVAQSSRLTPYSAHIHGVPQRVVNDVSSTVVRTLLREKRSVKYLTHDAVIGYIKKHALFT